MLAAKLRTTTMNISQNPNWQPAQSQATRSTTALVVGGYGAIGRSITRRLAAGGIDTAVAGRNKDKVCPHADDLATHSGTRSSGLSRDPTHIPATSGQIEVVSDELGGIAILVNCLGVVNEQPILEVTEERFDEVYRVNLKAAMFLAQSVARGQIARGRGGKHVHLMSIRSLLGFR